MNFEALTFLASCGPFGIGQSRCAAKAKGSYIVHLTGKPDQPPFTIIRSGSWLARANGTAALMNVLMNNRQQLANTPLPKSTTPDLHTISIHQMAPPEQTCGHPANLHKWQTASLDKCPCGHSETMNHIVESAERTSWQCSFYKYILLMIMQSHG